MCRLKSVFQILCIALLFCWVSPETMHARQDKPFLGGYFRDNDNDNSSLITFVAGLAGDKSWKGFIELMDKDRYFSRFDYLVYHSPDKFDIEQNVERIATELHELPFEYSYKVFVGHSIGGMIIKRLILNFAADEKEQSYLPDLMITFGTPLDTDKFTISLLKKLGARIFWFMVPALKREVFNIDRLKEINTSWRTAAKSSPVDVIRCVTVFGVEDTIARTEGEQRSKDTVFIKGSHMGIISPAGSTACPFVVFKAVLKDGPVNLQSIPCVVK